MILNNNSVDKNIDIQQASFLSFFKKPRAKSKKTINISYLTNVLIKMRILIFFTLGAELLPVCTSIKIHFLFCNWSYDSRRVTKNRYHNLGHGRLAGNSPEITWAEQKSKKIIISLTDGRRNLVDPSKWLQDLI